MIWLFLFLAAALTLYAQQSVYDFSLVSPDGKETPLKTYAGKVLLIVNLASHTTYSAQTAKLEALYQSYAAQGLVVLGIPSNDFGQGEPGKPDQVTQYYRDKLHVTFPLFAKTALTGKDQIPLYEFLTNAKLNAKTGGELPWNFTKYLIARDGKPIVRFDTGTPPDSPELIAAIETALEKKPAPQVSIADLRPTAIFAVAGAPDWMAVAESGVWVTSQPANHVVFLNARTNKTGPVATVAKPCSGLVSAFGSIWSPSCGDHALQRIDPATGKVIASVPVGPADSEGGIAAGAGSIWMLTDPNGILSRIDPQTNRVSAQINVPDGSFACTFGDGAIWVSSTRHDLLLRVDPHTNTVVTEIKVGSQPRFLTAGGGAVWTLNQGDGTISRIDTQSNTLVANIEAGLPGTGGEIAYGEGAVWVTMIGTPITRIDPQTNKVVKQWTGSGGDSIRAGIGSIWLTDLKGQKVMRLAPRSL